MFIKLTRTDGRPIWINPEFIVTVEGRKDGKPGLKVEAPFLIRGADGAETEEYRRICHRD